MPFCVKCGAQYDEGVRFCSKCGNDNSANTTGTAQPNAKQAPPKQEKNIIDKFMDTKDSTADFDPQDINNNKVISLFSYLGILFLIPMFGAKSSKYAQYHASQGLILFLSTILLNYISNFVTSTFSNVFYSYSWTSFGFYSGYSVLGWIITVIFNIIPLALAIIGIVNAVTGKAKRLPIIGAFKIVKEK